MCAAAGVSSTVALHHRPAALQRELARSRVLLNSLRASSNETTAVLASIAALGLRFAAVAGTAQGGLRPPQSSGFGFTPWQKDRHTFLYAGAGLAIAGIVWLVFFVPVPDSISPPKSGWLPVAVWHALTTALVAICVGGVLATWRAWRLWTRQDDCAHALQQAAEMSEAQKHAPAAESPRPVIRVLSRERRSPRQGASRSSFGAIGLRRRKARG